jgi:hypothetical protein
MDHTAGLAALLILLAGCTSSPATSHATASPTSTARTFAGGCAGTMLTDAEPPLWAQGGWTHTKGTPWGVPWALGTQGSSVAYVFASQLVAGSSPRSDGTNNKILWESKDNPSGDGVIVEGRPLGMSGPVVKIAGGPSTVDVPAAGCWTFQLSWSANGRHTSTINLEVLPAGTLPSKPA